MVESRKYENGQLVSVSKAEYNISGKVIKAFSFDSEENLLGSTIYEYKQDTTLIFGANRDGVENGVPYQKIYNNHGQIREEAYLYLPPTGRRITNKYFYSDEDLLIESHHFDAGFGEASRPLGIWKYEYF